MNEPRVGIVSLGEAGNFGDDLILVAVVQAVRKAAPTSTIEYLSFGQPIDWPALEGLLGQGAAPTRVAASRDLPGSRKHTASFSHSDAVIFGGGGLLQTTHNPDRPYQWLSYLPRASKGARVLAIGLGLGPLSKSWRIALKNLESPFDAVFVRDAKSLAMATEDLRWEAEQCRDFIDKSFLRQLWGSPQPAAKTRSLGVALRAWPGLFEEEVARHVMEIAKRHRSTDIQFFVLENKQGRGPDVDFTSRVRALIKDVPCEIHMYCGLEIKEFIGRMTACSEAVSMKLHSSAVWGALGVPMYPVIYAPKMAAYFGLDYSGLVMENNIVEPELELESVPRAADILIESLPSLLSRNALTRRGEVSAAQRLKFQWRGLYRLIRMRLRRAS